MPGRAHASSRFTEHVGELELVLEADTPEELFVEAARVVSRECGPVDAEPVEWERISLTARDLGTLLVDWLNELIGRSEVENRAYGDVRRLVLRQTAAAGADAGAEAARGETGTRPGDGASVTLEAEVRGRHVRSWESALKAATYHGLRLERQGDRWTAQVLLDV
jgi:SHS2 domain-containing protein